MYKWLKLKAARFLPLFAMQNYEKKHPCAWSVKLGAWDRTVCMRKTLCVIDFTCHDGVLEA